MSGANPGPSPTINRTTPQIANRRRSRLSTRATVLMLGTAAVATGLLIYWKFGPSARKEPPTQVTHSSAPIPLPPPPPIVPVVANVPAPPRAAPPPPPAVVAQAPSIKEEVKQATGGSQPGMVSFQVPPVLDVFKPHGSAAGAAPSSTHVAFKAAEIPGAKAGMLGDRSLMLMPGLIRCSVDNAIQTDFSGDFTCHLPGDVDSPRHVVLLDKNTQVMGHYESKVSEGTHRVMSTSLYAITPNGCTVPLGGGVTDSLGRTGMVGAVDTHFWPNFGNALLVSLVDNGFNLAQAALSKNGSTYLSFNSGGDGVGSIARDLLRSAPPTVSVNEGEDIGIWIQGPIDFSDCYTLETRR